MKFVLNFFKCLNSVPHVIFLIHGKSIFSIGPSHIQKLLIRFSFSHSHT